MNRHHIICLPKKALRQASEPIDITTIKQLKPLIEDMKQATLDWEDHRQHEVGVALAAIQINQPVRLVIVRRDFRNKADRDFDVFINPSITRTEGEPVKELEGCLSVKDIYGEVERFPKVKVKAIDENGQLIKRVAKGFLARIFQHEIDHTEGLTFIDRCGESGSYFQLEADGAMQQLSPDERSAFLKRVGYFESTKPQKKQYVKK